MLTSTDRLMANNPGLSSALNNSPSQMITASNYLDPTKVQSTAPAVDPTQQVYERNKAYTKPDASNFQTMLAPAEEAQFQQWLLVNKVPFDINQTGPQDYDMRGFWKALMSGDPKARSAIDPNDSKLHYPDYWKTPYHETFSNESQWADPAKAPRWNDKDQLITPDGTVLYDDRAPKKGQ